MSVVVTGASGFVGFSVATALAARGEEVRGVGRGPAPMGWDTSWPWFPSADGIAPPRALEGCAAVIHAAGRAHTTVAYDETGRDLFDEPNHLLAIRSAEAACAAGVRRFVFVSTIGVHGNWSAEVIDENSPVAAATPYARSKWAAELGLSRRYGNGKMALAIVRPPMVYGRDAPGNFLRLVKLVKSGVPLPFANVVAVRSFIHVENLASFLTQCALTVQGLRIFVPHDGSDWALPELVSQIASVLGVPARQFACPVALLRLAGAATGREREIDSLTRPMVISASSALVDGWFPEPANLLLAASLTKITDEERL